MRDFLYVGECARARACVCVDMMMVIGGWAGAVLFVIVQLHVYI